MWLSLSSTVLQQCRDEWRGCDKLHAVPTSMGQSLQHTLPVLLDSIIYFIPEETLEMWGCSEAAGRQGGGLWASLEVPKVGDPKIDTLDPFPCPAGPWVWREFPWEQRSGFEAESSTLSSHEVYNSIFIAFLSNKVYGTSGTHSVKNADSLYEFLMVEEEQGRPRGELVKC